MKCVIVGCGRNAITSLRLNPGEYLDLCSQHTLRFHMFFEFRKNVDPKMVIAQIPRKRGT